MNPDVNWDVPSIEDMTWILLDAYSKWDRVREEPLSKKNQDLMIWQIFSIFRSQNTEIQRFTVKKESSGVKAKGGDWTTFCLCLRNTKRSKYSGPRRPLWGNEARDTWVLPASSAEAITGVEKELGKICGGTFYLIVWIPRTHMEDQQGSGEW